MISAIAANLRETLPNLIPSLGLVFAVRAFFTFSGRGDVNHDDEGRQQSSAGAAY